MIWNITVPLGSRNLDLALDLRPPFQGIYKLWLRYKWANSDFLDEKKSKEFISHALRYLPWGYYIAFHFDEKGEQFVQFYKSGWEIFLEIPIWQNNVYNSHNQQIKRLLKSKGLKEGSYKDDVSHRNTQTFIYYKGSKERRYFSVNLDDNDDLAAEIALLIAKELLKLKHPNLFHYESDRLQNNPLHVD